MEIDLEKEFLFPPSLENLQNLMDEEFWEISPKGERFSKKDILEYRKTFPRMELDIKDFQTRLLGDRTILNSYQILHHQEKKTSVSLRTSIWENQYGTWRIVAHHSTRV